MHILVVGAAGMVGLKLLERLSRDRALNCVAADFIKRGIRANAICPGTIQSPSLDDRIATLAKSTGQTVEAVRQAFVDRQPMGRLGTSEEIADMAVYLASEEAGYTTGQIFLVDGGFAL